MASEYSRRKESQGNWMSWDRKSWFIDTLLHTTHPSSSSWYRYL